MQEEIKDKGISIYPNTTTGQLHITLGHAPLWEDAVIEIYSVVGQKLLSQNSPFEGGRGMSEITIDVSHLANGMYFLKIENQVVKFVKQ